MSNENFEQEIRNVLDHALPKVEPTRKAVEINTREWRFGVGMLILSVFVLVLILVLPDIDRWMFGGFAFVLLCVGAYKIDRSNHAEPGSRTRHKKEQ